MGEEFPSEESLSISDEELELLGEEEESKEEASKPKEEEESSENAKKKEEVSSPAPSSTSQNEDYDLAFKNKIDNIIDLIVGDDEETKKKLKEASGSEKSVSFILSELDDLKKEIGKLKEQKDHLEDIEKIKSSFVSLKEELASKDAIIIKLSKDVEAIKSKGPQVITNPAFKDESLKKEFEEFKKTTMTHLIKHYRLLDVMTRKMNER